MDGVLVIDNPPGPTSHDVVARVRRALGLSRIGHTGTLDPLATGVLPLVIGRATRLASFLSATEKEYDAGVRLGAATETYDAAHRAGPPPPRAGRHRRGAHRRALDEFRGTYAQMPPPYSAKKIDGVAGLQAGPPQRARGAARGHASPSADLSLDARTTMGWRACACGSSAGLLRPIAGARSRARASAAARISRRCGACAPARSTRPRRSPWRPSRRKGAARAGGSCPSTAAAPRPGRRAERTGRAAGGTRQRRRRPRTWSAAVRRRVRRAAARDGPSPGDGACWTRGACCSASRNRAPAGFCIPSLSWCKILSRLEL